MKNVKIHPIKNKKEKLIKLSMHKSNDYIR